MASQVYDSATFKMATGAMDMDTDTFKCMLVTSAYTPNKKTHVNRSDVTNEITGTGYTAGGATVTVTATNDTTNDRTDISLGGNTWASSTITARGAVYYKNTGNASTDALVAYIDFGADISSTNAAFALTASTWRLPAAT